MDTTCIMCPMGCALRVEEKEGKVVVTGNTCPRGEKYGAAEYSHPERVVTTLLKTDRGGVVSVKTDRPIPKDKIEDFLAWAATFRVQGPVFTGDVLAQDPAGCGASVVATTDYGV